MRKKICKVQLDMLWPNDNTNGTQSNGAHAQQQNSQGPRGPGLAVRRPASARLSVISISSRRSRILLGREPAQPKRAAGIPDGPEAIAERHSKNGNPERDMANDAEALAAELPPRRNLEANSCQLRRRGRSDRIWCNTKTYPDLLAAAVAGPQAVPPSGVVKGGSAHRWRL